jgi:hypothetical protein
MDDASIQGGSLSLHRRTDGIKGWRLGSGKGINEGKNEGMNRVEAQRLVSFVIRNQ